MTQPPPGGYPPPSQPGPPPGGYPPPAQSGPAGYPGQNPGGYPGQAPGSYPGQAPGGYPGQDPSGAPPAGGYPPAGATPAGYPPPGQAYPPPGPGYPPPGQGYPPPGQGYPPVGYGQPGYPQPGAARSSFDASKVTIADWIIIGAGVVLLLFSFFGWVSYTYSSGYLGYNYSYSFSVGAWHEYWWLATVLGVGVSAVVAARATMGQPLPQIKPIFLVAAAGAGALITLIALIEIFASGGSALGDSVGPGFGIWICLIVALAQTYFVWLWAQKQPGTKLPTLPGPSF